MHNSENRKIIQVFGTDEKGYPTKVLCNDGTMWVLCYTKDYPIQSYWNELDTPTFWKGK